MKEKREPYLVRIPGREVWYIRDGSSRVSTGRADATDAAAELAAYKSRKNGEMVRRGKGGIRTVSELLKFWGKEHCEKPGGEDSWKSKWRYVVRTIERHAGHKALERIDFDWSREYVELREDEGVMGPTVRQELTTLLGAWRSAYGRGLLLLEPPSFDVPPPSEPRDIFLTKEEARALISACNKAHLKLFVRLGLATGGRPGAVLALRWAHVDLENGRVDFRPSGQRRRAVVTAKRADGKRAALVPIGEDIISELREARAIAQTDFVIEFSGKPVSSVKKSFASALKRAGLDAEVTPHILRHSAATWMAQAGVPMWEIAGFLGHSSTAMVEKVYGHHAPEFMTRGRDALKL